MASAIIPYDERGMHLQAVKRSTSGSFREIRMTLDASNPSFPVLLVEAFDTFSRATSLVVSFSDCLPLVLGGKSQGIEKSLVGCLAEDEMKALFLDVVAVLPNCLHRGIKGQLELCFNDKILSHKLTATRCTAAISTCFA